MVYIRHIPVLVLVAGAVRASPSYTEKANDATALLLSDLAIRAFPVAPDGYTPAEGNCPSARPTIRSAASLSPQESSWLQTRRPKTVQPMMDFMSRLNFSGTFDPSSYIQTHQNNLSALPNIGIASSGGGYRALMNGAGNLEAFDSRTPNSTAPGQLGGLLQSATYLAGLSGSSWLVGSLYVNNFTSVNDILTQNGQVWDFTNSIIEGPDQGLQIVSTVKYYTDLYEAVNGKSDAGFNTSITDYWGRALSYQLINATDGGPSFTWSSVANNTVVLDGTAPLPILIADGRRPGEVIIAQNTTIFEFNPWEMGTWDPTVFGFAPLEYAGSNFSAGTLPSDQSCVRGFDNAGFVMGTSSSLFNQFILQLNGASGIPSLLQTALTTALAGLGEHNDDISEWSPNPFFGYHPDTNHNADTSTLSLVDGGENNENVPLHPLVQPVRYVDVIFAIDSSADTSNNWPNGSSLVQTYERSRNATIQNNTAFPSIPDINTSSI